MQISFVACRRKLQEATEALATLLEQVRAAPQLSDPDFIRLNKQLEEFSSRLDSGAGAGPAGPAAAGPIISLKKNKNKKTRSGP